MGDASLEERHAEFGERVAGSQNDKAAALVASIEEAYAALDSYSDTGHHETVHGGRPLIRVDFETKYRDPGDIYFKFVSNPASVMEMWGAFSRIGDTVTEKSSFTPDETHSDIGMAIASLYGVSSRTSGNIPSILVEDDGDILFRLAGLHTVEETQTIEGVECKGSSR